MHTYIPFLESDKKTYLLLNVITKLDLSMVVDWHSYQQETDFCASNMNNLLFSVLEGGGRPFPTHIFPSDKYGCFSSCHLLMVMHHIWTSSCSFMKYKYLMSGQPNPGWELTGSSYRCGRAFGVIYFSSAVCENVLGSLSKKWVSPSVPFTHFSR